MIGQKVITCQTNGTYSATPTCKELGENLVILLFSSVSGNLKDLSTVKKLSVIKKISIENMQWTELGTLHCMFSFSIK